MGGKSIFPGKARLLAFAYFLAVAGCFGGGGSDGGGGEGGGPGSVASQYPACGSVASFFSVAPMSSGDYNGIDPLGNVAAPAHTFPTVHTYMFLTDNQNPSPVYSPGEITITGVSQSRNITDASTDYSIEFVVCAEVFGYFIHVTTLTDDILSQTGEFTDCRTYSDGVRDYELCNKQVAITVSAGQQIGNAGGPGAASGALDLGLRDTRTSPIAYANPDRLVNSDQFYVVCPYDYYESGAAKDELFSQLRTLRTAEPVCGSVAYDISGTAQGKWFAIGSSGEGEQDHLALVSSNQLPDVGVLSVGNSSVGTGVYFFDFSGSGPVNGRFSDVTADGSIHCFDNLRDQERQLGSPIGGYLFLTLISDTELKIERARSGSCPGDPNTLAFSGSAVDFKR